MGRCAWFRCCKRDVELGLSTAEPEGSDNEGFSQEWFDENCGFIYARQEAEALPLQQLQIEQEIQELEQAQEQLLCFNCHEILNKASPPYFPLGQTCRTLLAPIPSVSHILLGKQESTKEPLFVPSTTEELTSLTLNVISYLYKVLTFSGDVEHAEVLPVCYDRNSVPTCDVQRSSRRIFKKLVFDLVKDMVKEAYGWTREAPSAPWEWPAFSRKRSKPLPRSKEMFQDVILKQVLVLFGFKPEAYKEKLVIRWSCKDRDYIDKILMKECHEEESAWTNYDEDEVTVKNEIALGILDSLLYETVQIILHARKTKYKKSYELTLTDIAVSSHFQI